MGTIDFSALKLKLLSSIVAISAIQLLKQFMEIKKVLATPGGERELFWYVVVHLIFVASSVLLALSDRIAGEHHAKPETGNVAAQDHHGGSPQADKTARPAAHAPPNDNGKQASRK